MSRKIAAPRLVPNALRMAFFGLCALGLAVAPAPAYADRMSAAPPVLVEKAVAPPATWQVRRDYSRFPLSLALALPALSKAEAAARFDAGQPGQPLRVGLSRELPDAYRGDLAKTVRWAALDRGDPSHKTALSRGARGGDPSHKTALSRGARGGDPSPKVASFNVRSPDAKSLRLLVRAALPEGAVMRFFAADKPNRRYPPFKGGDFVAQGPAPGAESTGSGARARWSPVISGDTLGVEIELPPSADPADVSFSIVRASHLWGSPAAAPAAVGLATKNAASCGPVDVACKALPSCPRGAVARIVFTLEDGETYTCTGTALNSSRSMFDNFDTPFFLTAEHCVGLQSAADSVVTYWHYEHETCDGDQLHPDYVDRQGGADLVTSDSDTDASLLRLRDALPNSACLAGWDAQSGWASATDVVSLHHPARGVKEWVGGQISQLGLSLVEGTAIDTIDVAWSQGSTRGGSSGAGLFTTVDDDEQALIGLLSGGPVDDCTQDSFGRFDRFYASHAGVHLAATEVPPPDDHGGAAENATGVLTGSENPGQIDDGSDADVFRVDILERGTLTAYTTGTLDTVGRLKGTDGRTIDFDDDGGQGRNFKIEAEVAAGTYYVKVTGYNHTEVGGYRLHLEFLSASAGKQVLVPLFLSASAMERHGRESYVRVFNRSSRSGEVRVSATDDSGESPGAVTLSMGPETSRHFNSGDLELGNPEKGLAGRTGPGVGDWRLAFGSELDIEVAAYVRTRDGFMTGMHDVAVLEDRTGAHHVPIFNPASNVEQRSKLRLINPDPDNPVDVTITGYDDDGERAQVGLRLLPGSARTLDALDLEEGGGDLSGRLGDGEGKWRLFIEAGGEIHVVNLLDSVTGNLSNLSLPGGDNYR